MMLFFLFLSDLNLTTEMKISMGVKILFPEPLDPDWPAVGFHQLQDHIILLLKLTSAHIDGYFKYRLASDSFLNSDINAVEKGHKMVERNKVYVCSVHINKPNMRRDTRFPTKWYVRSAKPQISLSVKLRTEHHLEFLSFKGGCTGSSESTLVKMPHC